MDAGQLDHGLASFKFRFLRLPLVAALDKWYAPTSCPALVADVVVLAGTLLRRGGWLRDRHEKSLPARPSPAPLLRSAWWTWPGLALVVPGRIWRAWWRWPAWWRPGGRRGALQAPWWTWPGWWWWWWWGGQLARLVAFLVGSGRRGGRRGCRRSLGR